jgi:hypothetical protein
MVDDGPEHEGRQSPCRKSAARVNVPSTQSGQRKIPGLALYRDFDNRVVQKTKTNDSNRETGYH